LQSRSIQGPDVISWFVSTPRLRNSEDKELCGKDFNNGIAFTENMGVDLKREPLIEGLFKCENSITIRLDGEQRNVAYVFIKD